MTQIQIPQTIEEARANLNGLGALLTAKQWERAAIVYAFTADDVKANQYARSTSTTGMTPREFAKLGIVGLQSDASVRDYRKAWQSAMEDGAAEAKPGEAVELPSLPWKDHFGESTREVQQRVARSYVLDPEKLTDLLRDQTVREVMVQVIADDPQAVSEIMRLVRAAVGQAVREVATPRARDYDALIVQALDALMASLQAEKRGDWSPSPISAALLHFIARLLTERSEPAESSTSLFDEIHAYLKTEAVR